MTARCTFGGLELAFSGGAKWLERALADFDTGSGNGYEPQSETPDLEFVAMESTEDLWASHLGQDQGIGSRQEAVSVGGLVFDDPWTFFRRGRVRLALRHEDGILRKVVVQITPTRRRCIAALLPRSLQRLLHPRYVDVDELDALEFLFRGFQPMAQLGLLSKARTFLHASSFVHRASGQGVLVSGWGGVGKTTTCAHLILGGRGDYAFLADDMSILSSSGRLHQNPMGIHLFPYNTAGYQRLQEVVRERMSWLERCHWEIRRRWLGSDRVVRRLAPQVLYSRRLADSAEVGLSLVLRRTASTEGRVKAISEREFATLAANVLLYEMRKLTILLTASAGAPGGANRWGLNETGGFVRDVENICLAGLSNASTLAVDLPRSWNALEIGQFVGEVVDEHLA